MGETVGELVLGLNVEVGPSGQHAVEHVARVAHEAGGHFEHASEAAREMGDHIREIVALAGIGFGLEGLKKMFIEPNAEVEQMNRRLGTLLSATYKFSREPGDNLAEGFKYAGEMIERFQAKAEQTGVQKSVYEGIASSLAPIAGAARLSTEELEKLTYKLGDISRVTGSSGQEMAQAIMMAAEGGQARSPAIRAILATSGVDTKSFAMMGQHEKINALLKAINGFQTDAISKTTTWADAVGQARAVLEDIEETAGKPLFAEVSNEVKTMGKWLRENREAVTQTAREVVGGLSRGIKEVVGFTKTLAEHWDAIKATAIGVAGIWATLKVTGMAEEIGSDIAGAFKKGIGAYGESVGKSWGKTFVGVVEAAGIGYAIGTALDNYLQTTDWWKKAWTPAKTSGEALSDARIALQNETTKFLGSMSKGELLAAAREARASGAAKVGVIDFGAAAGQDLYAKLGDIHLAMRTYEARHTTQMKGLDLSGVVMPRLNQYNSVVVHQTFDKSHDPDEIAFSMADILRQVGENPRQAPSSHTHAGGGR